MTRIIEKRMKDNRDERTISERGAIIIKEKLAINSEKRAKEEKIRKETNNDRR